MNYPQVDRASVTAFWIGIKILTFIAFNDATNPQVRKAAGMFLYCLKQTAKRITGDESNCHYRRIVEDEEFYKHWLFPRFERFYNRRGWAVDGTISGTSSGRSAGSSTRTGGAPGRKKRAPRRLCLPFRLKSGHRSKEFSGSGSLESRRQPEKKHVDLTQPQVGPASCLFRSLRLL